MREEGKAHVENINENSESITPRFSLSGIQRLHPSNLEHPQNLTGDTNLSIIPRDTNKHYGCPNVYVFMYVCLCLYTLSH